VPEQDRNADVSRIESPGQAERDRVVDPPVVGAAQGLGVGLDEHRADVAVRDHPPVQLRQVGFD
jgi:hypothetical protein